MAKRKDVPVTITRTKDSNGNVTIEARNDKGVLCNRIQADKTKFKDEKSFDDCVSEACKMMKKLYPNHIYKS